MSGWVRRSVRAAAADDDERGGGGAIVGWAEVGGVGWRERLASWYSWFLEECRTAVFGGVQDRSSWRSAGTNYDGTAFGVGLLSLVCHSGGCKGVSGIPLLGQQV